LRFRDAKGQLGGGEARNRTRAPPDGSAGFEPRTDPIGVSRIASEPAIDREFNVSASTRIME